MQPTLDQEVKPQQNRPLIQTELLSLQRFAYKILQIID